MFVFLVLFFLFEEQRKERRRKKKKTGLDDLCTITQEYCAIGVESKPNLNTSILFLQRPGYCEGGAKSVPLTFPTQTILGVAQCPEADKQLHH